MENVQLRELQPKKTPIRDDYNLSHEELGDGVNGKVLACHSRADGRKCALKVTIHAKIIGGGRPLLLEILDQGDRVGAKSPNFDLFSLVALKKFLSVKIVSDRVVRHSLS